MTAYIIIAALSLLCWKLLVHKSFIDWRQRRQINKQMKEAAKKLQAIEEELLKHERTNSVKKEDS